MTQGAVLLGDLAFQLGDLVDERLHSGGRGRRLGGLAGVGHFDYRLLQLGDLDIALFRIAKDPDTNLDTPQRVLADVTAVENACIEANNLMPGTYYVVIRGTTTPEKPGTYSMNRYNLKVYTTTTGASCVKRDGGV